MTDTNAGDGWYEALWPRSPLQVRHKQLAPRPASLDGKVVAGLWDNLFRGDQMLDTLEQALRQRFPHVRFVSWREFGNIHGNDERAVLAALPRRLKEMGVDAVICGVAA